MQLSVVFGFVTIVVLFQFVYADVKPITLTEVEKSSDVQLKPETGEKLLRLPRTSWKKGGYGGYGGGCTGGCGGYVAPQPCNTCQGGLQGYGGGSAMSYSQSSATSNSGSWGSGKKK